MNFLQKIKRLFQLFRAAIVGDPSLDYTSISLNRAIFLLSVPMILEMAMESLFAVVDVFFVSQVSVDAIAIIGLTESVLTIVYSVAIGVSMAATAMVARRIGEKNEQAAAIAAVQAIYLGILVAAFIAAIGLFFSADILRLMGGSPEVIRVGENYISWMLGGNVVILLLFLNNGIFRGAGDAHLAMRALWIANILNMILDPIFIFGWGPIPAFGVEGAAYATNTGRGIGVLYQLYHLAKGNGVIKIGMQHLKVQASIIIRLIKVAAGGTGQFLLASSSWVFLVRIISMFGSEALAGYTIGIRVIIFTILPAWGMANAAATLVGQHLGAGLPDRAEKAVWRTAFYNMIFLGLVSVVYIVWAKSVVSFFTTEPEVLSYGIQCLQFVSMGYIFYAYGMVLAQSFNGAGDTRTPTLLNFFGFWVLQIPIAYILAVTADLGPKGVFMAIAIAESILAVTSIIVFRKGNWKKTKI